MHHFSSYFSAIAAFFSAFLMACFAIPRIIYVAKKKRLLDRPDNHRKVHTRVIPNLGGIGIFFAYIISSSLFVNPVTFPDWSYMSAATMLLFFAGAKDDLVELSPSKKFLAQAITAAIVVYFADIQIRSLHGLFGVYEIPEWFGSVFTIIGCVFVTNAFNLIDGIDGLAGSISLLASLVLGCVFFSGSAYSESILCFTLGGAIGGFLLFNKPPARIFMGDTGSLIIGFTLAVLCVLIVSRVNDAPQNFKVVHSPVGALLLSLAVLFVPLFDTFRVFAVRIMKGHSPFKADRTHLHHYLLDIGFSHGKAVLILIGANIFILAVAYLLQDINPHLAILTMIVVAFGLFLILFFLRHRKVDPHIKPIRKLIPRREPLA